jgi:MFS family permease
MEIQEVRAAASLAGVFSVRLLGLFMIYPVFAEYARHLSGSTPYMIGLALGSYGLSQGLLQIPFGLLSDKIGRKVMIVLGLMLFGIGSAVAAISTSIDGVIVGRVLQGAGAVGSVILALVADLTAEENRTKAMAVVGITIGTSFMIALVLGPIIASFIGVGGIFWLMAVLALVGIAITQFVVPNPRRVRVHRDAEAVPEMIGSVLRNRELLRLDFGIFALHAMLTASFKCDNPQSMGHLSACAFGFTCRDGSDNHCRREAPSHEGRIRKCGRCAGGEPNYALRRRP